MGASRIVTLVRWHRRGVAAVLAGIAVFAALSALTRTDAGEQVTVVVASRLVAAGSTVRADDLRLARLPSAAVPEAPLTSLSDALGKVAGAGLRPGQVLTDLSLVGAAVGDGTVVLSVRVDNPELAALAPPGTRVSLYATTSTEAVASQVLVVAVPAVENGGILSGKGSTVLLVRVSPADAGRITKAMAGSTLTLAIG